MRSLIVLIFASIATASFGQDTIGYRVNPAKPRAAIQHKAIDPDSIGKYTATYGIKRQALMPGSMFNSKLLEPIFTASELEGKRLLIVFWKGDCDGCVENMARLNPQLRALMKEKNSVLISITPDNKNSALDVQRYTPMEHTDMISNGKSIIDKIGIKTFPAFIFTDANHKIEFALRGNEPEMYSLIKHHLINSTNSAKGRLSP